MNRMEKEYNDILNLDFDRENRIPLVTADSFVCTAFRSTEKLDGLWGFTPDVFRTFTRKRLGEVKTRDEQGRPVPVDLDFNSLLKAEVPGCWNCQEERLWYYEGEAVYSRSFYYEKENASERLFLKIGAANYESRIWLNGKLAARHKGGFTPFSVEITDLVRQENHLVITVNNRREMEQVPSMTYDWFNYGGITRSVELIRVPSRFIRVMEAALVPDKTFHNIRLRARLNEPEEGVYCRFVIEELGIDTTVQTDENGTAECILWASPQLWDCENPRLYHIEAWCGQPSVIEGEAAEAVGEKTGALTWEDYVEDYVGFREIRVQGKDIFLNGKKIYLRGVCCHEESRKGGRILSEEERMEIFHTAREMGCNILRLTHYPHSEQMALLADKMGMLLWEEIPVYWAIDFSNKDTYEDARNQLRELIVRDRNRASVVIWSVGNENPDTEERLQFMSGLAAVCREMDDTRLVSAACLVDVNTMSVKDRLIPYVDVVAFNEYYGWYYRDYEGLKEILDHTAIEKPVVISETGAGARAGHFGGREELFTEEHQEKFYQKQIEYADGRIQGMFPWILYDFVSPIRMNPWQEGKNSKGLIAMDKTTKKKAFYIMQEYYQRKAGEEKE